MPAPDSGTVPVGVLVSGRGSNLGALLDAATAPGYPAHVALVLSNRSGVGALELAAARGVASRVMPVGDFGGDNARRDAAMLAAMQGAGVRLVVCAGYDRVLSDSFVDAFPDAILNVHPSLLPAFGGSMKGVAEALAYGVKITGCTVQLLERGDPDGGAIVLQAAVPIKDDDDVTSLHERIHKQEWRILPEAVALWCLGRLWRDGRRIRVEALVEGGRDSAPAPAPAPGLVRLGDGS